MNAVTDDLSFDRLRVLHPVEVEWKQRIYQRLLSLLDLARLSRTDDRTARIQIRDLTNRLFLEESAPLSLAQRQLIQRQIEDEVLGLGPLEPLLSDPTISDILVNGSGQVYLERKGKLERSSIRFHDDAHLMNIIDRIVSAVGRRVDESAPMVDARLKDGSRVNVIIPPLAIDGPGQGEALRLQGITGRYDSEVPAGAAFDYVAQRPDVDPARIAIMGISMGGYYAPRAAAMDPRFAACVAWGGHFDYHESWIRRRREIESGGTRVSAPYFHLLWVLGVPDMDAAMKKLEQFRLAGVAERISCPFLCVHGGNDTIVPVDYARRLFAAVGAQDKTLHVFDADEGGSEHCQGDNRILGATFVADWLADRLVKGRAIVG